MADRIAEFPTTRAKPLLAKYPWARWMDGSVWRIERNRDFMVKPKDMQTLLYIKARRKSTASKPMKVRVTKTGPDTIVFQFYDPTEVEV